MNDNNQNDVDKLNQEYDEANNHEYFNYLNELRDSGVTNMFGATPYLMDEFALSQNEARDILGKWMESFNG